MLDDILVHTDKSELDEFIRDHTKSIQKAFADSQVRSSRRYVDYGFDAEAVSEKLETILEKARFFVRHDNKDEAICIVQKLIDIIPDYWEDTFDQEGVVQEVYEGAIELLAEMLENKLSREQVESVFSWYEKVIEDRKHESMGLNTSLEMLEQYFVSDAENGFDRILRIVNQRIANAETNYEKERAVLEKIALLEEHHGVEDTESIVEEYISYPGVRKIRLRRLLAENEYDKAIALLQEGIAIARKKQERNTEYEWLKELLSVYEWLNNSKKVMEITKKLFVLGIERRAFYKALQRITPKAEWNEMLAWILRNLESGDSYRSSELKADIFVEHKMWDDLWRLCRGKSIEFIRSYEESLRTGYEKELLALYLTYVQQQAAITDKKAYITVANMLNRMKSFEGGPAIVAQLISQYRQVYKRRIYMMKELDKVEV
jgi:tetratricopeptide (TPR) repeat protein